MCACRLPLAPVAPGRGRLTYLCALTVSPTQGHADLLLVTFDKLGHVTFITVLPNFLCLVKIISVYTLLLGAPLFVWGYPARPSASLQ